MRCNMQRTDVRGGEAGEELLRDVVRAQLRADEARCALFHFVEPELRRSMSPPALGTVALRLTVSASVYIDLGEHSAGRPGPSRWCAALVASRSRTPRDLSGAKSICPVYR